MAGRVIGNVVSDNYVGVMTKEVDAVDSALLSARILFFGKDFLQINVYVSPLQGSRFNYVLPRAARTLAGPLALG